MAVTNTSLNALISKWEHKVGTPVNPDEVAAQDLADYCALLQSVADRAARSLEGDQILTVVTTRTQSGAWAFRDGISPGVHVIVVTRGMIARIQQLAQAAHNATLDLLHNQDTPAAFTALWGPLPRDSAHAVGFAQFLAHVAFVLLVNHELAHIVIGHTYYAGAVGECEPIDEGEELGATNDLLAAVQGRVPEKKRRSQAFETDADMHALLWTDDYLLSFNPNSQFLDALDEVTKAVHLEMAQREDARRFVLISASWVMFCALGGTLPTPEALSLGSHPPLGMRLMSMLHNESAIASDRTQSYVTPLFNASSFGAFVFTHAFKPRPTIEEALDRLGVSEAMNKWDALMAHHDRLIVERKRFETLLRPLRLPGMREINWWSPAPEHFR